MPMCETCGSVALRDELDIDEEMDRTTCPRCREAGPSHGDTRFRLSTVFTEEGVEIVARSPVMELTVKDRWVDIAAKLSSWRQERSRLKASEPPRLVEVKEA